MEQNKDFPLFYTGWYGLCEDCEPFELISGTSNSDFARIYDEIQAVFVASENQQGTIPYTGFQSIPAFIGLMPLKRLECGKYYRIILKPGVGSVNIPHFVHTTASTEDAYRLVIGCV